jgi:hypothetical protein
MRANGDPSRSSSTRPSATRAQCQRRWCFRPRACPRPPIIRLRQRDRRETAQQVSPHLFSSPAALSPRAKRREADRTQVVRARGAAQSAGAHPEPSTLVHQLSWQVACLFVRIPALAESVSRARLRAVGASAEPIRAAIVTLTGPLAIRGGAGCLGFRGFRSHLVLSTGRTQRVRNFVHRRLRSALVFPGQRLPRRTDPGHALR